MSINQSAGIYKCVIHNFSCGTLDEMRAHNAEFVHTHRGKAPCNRCETPTEFVVTTKLKGKSPALCADCKAELLEENS